MEESITIIISMEAQRNIDFFVDTSAFAALFVQKEISHQHYQEFFKKLSAQPNLQFTTTDYVIDEWFTLLRYRYHVPASDIVAFYEQLLAGGLKVWFVTRTDFSKSMLLAKKYHDHLLSFTDATTVVVMHYHGLKKILTMDKDFQAFGFEMI